MWVYTDEGQSDRYLAAGLPQVGNVQPMEIESLGRSPQRCSTQILRSSGGCLGTGETTVHRADGQLERQRWLDVALTIDTREDRDES